MKHPVISKDVSYTFSDYLKFIKYAEDLLSYFGYSFQRQECTLPHSHQELEHLDDLKLRFKGILPYISMTSEAARREFLIAPILMEAVYHTHAQLKVEFYLTVTDQLKGIIDYYLEAKNNCLIIEAKDGDLEKGFIQLAAEMVALDQWLETPTQTLYGAVSIGNVWQFGILKRDTKLFIQDLNLLRVPTDLEELLKVLRGILEE
jgi:hypothetical protein